MTDEQRKHYTSFKEIAMTIVDDEVVSATEAMSQLLRLQQVLCGYLPVNDVLTDIANNRVDAMMEAIEEIDGKVIIWARFVEDIRRIESALKKKYGNSSTGSYYGGTSDEERERIVEDFQNPESELRFFVGNAQTAGFGLTLTAASNVIYYSNNFNLEHRVQSEDRCHRIGQKNPVTYIDLVVPDSVDEHIVKALRNKINLAGRSLGEQMREWLKV
jgi:SNF2 family DNA or RNA helicase